MALILLTFIALLCFLVHAYYKHIHIFNKNLKRFPCPPEVPILGNALDFFSDKEVLDVLMSYVNNYGDIVRVKTGIRQLLLISDYNLFEFLLTTKKILKRSMDYKYCYKWLGKGLITSEGAKWKEHRQIITPTFNYKVLANFVDVFESNGKILVKQFEKNLDRTSVDVYKFLDLCTLDIICECAMGTSVKAQENMESEYVQSIKDMLTIIQTRAFTPHKMIDWIYFFTEDYTKEQKALKVLHSYTWNVIKRRQEAFYSEQKDGSREQKRKTFLDLLLEANRQGQDVTLEEIREEIDTFMFAAHDTTASAISFTLFCLANHPEEQAKVLMEQKQIFGDNFDPPVSLQDLKNMKYLELVIKESLRLYPPGAFFSRELDQDVVYDGTVLPKRLTLTFFVYGLHRNPKYFSDPDKFLPSRFETVDGKVPFAYLPFGAGPRICIGQNFAMAEIKSVVSRIVRSLELLPSIPVHELKVASQLILISSNGICMRFKKRKQAESEM